MIKITKALNKLESDEKATSRFCLTNVKLILNSNESWVIEVSDLFLKRDYEITGDTIDELNKWAEERLNGE